jgi:hypothetical protein
VNVAQKVRLWFMLATAIINAIVLVGLGAVPGYQLATGGAEPWYVWLLITFVANVTLGSVSLYRFMHPLAPKQPPAHTGGYPPYSTHPQPPQYPPYQQPPGPYQQPQSPSGR